MPLPPIDHGLKEWNAVCRALGMGRQIILLRKGGIHEVEGEFVMERMQFALFPTWLHQNSDWIKPADRDALALSAEPEVVPIDAVGQVTDIVRVPSRAQIDAINDQHIYLSPLIDMRFNYKPNHPLYLLLVRAYRLPSTVALQNTPAFAGCRSWVPFERPIERSGATPALTDDAYAARRLAVLSTMGSDPRQIMK
ncbi:MAG TPA: DUF1802 family protein [Tepidisphaeraceae bacterium]